MKAAVMAAFALAGGLLGGSAGAQAQMDTQARPTPAAADPAKPGDAAKKSPDEAAGDAPLALEAPGDLVAELTALGLTPAEIAEVQAQQAMGVLNETVVTAPPLDLQRIAGSAASIDEEALNQFEYSDVHRVLEKVAGVYLRGEDGFGLRPNIGLRGANSDRSSKVALMEDGIPLAPAPYSAPAAYYFPAMNRLVGVDVYKGPASIRFGPQTVGGAVNVLTRRIPQDGVVGVADLAVGLHEYGRVHGAVGYGDERFGVLAEGVHWRSSGFKQLDSGGGTGFAKNEAMLKARYAPSGAGSAKQSLQLKLGIANEESDETYLGLSDPDFAVNPYRRYAASQLDHMSWIRTQAQLSWNLKLGAPFDLTVTAYRHDFSRAWKKLNRFFDPRADLQSVLADPTSGRNAVYAGILRGEEDTASEAETLMIGTNDRRFVSQGLNAEGVVIGDALGVEHLVRFGARAHYDRVERNQYEDPYDMISGRLVASTALDRQLNDLNRGSTLAFSAYAVDEILWGRLLVTPGLRVELVQTRFANHKTGAVTEDFHPVVLPGVGALYHLNEDFSAFAGVYRGFSPPTPQPNPADPEYSVNYEVGGRFHRRKTNAELIGFFNDYSNLTRNCTFSTGCREDQLDQQFNAGRVHVYGLEAVAGHELEGPLGVRLRVNGTYTLTLSRFLTRFSSTNPQFGEVEPGYELPYVPVHQAALGATALGESWSVGLSTTLVGEMRERAGMGPIEELYRIPPHAVVDLSAGWKPIQGGELYMTVENLLNTPYLAARRPFGARPGRPLFVQAGYRHQF